MFKGTTAFFGNAGDIAVDDIALNNCARNSVANCPSGQVSCTDKTNCYPPSAQCDFGQDCCDGSDEASCCKYNTINTYYYLTTIRNGICYQ